MTPMVMGILAILVFLLVLVFKVPSTGDRYIILPKSKNKTLRKMRQLSESQDNKELVGKAMTHYEMVLSAAAEGGQLVIRRPNGEEEGFMLP